MSDTGLVPGDAPIDRDDESRPRLTGPAVDVPTGGVQNLSRGTVLASDFETADGLWAKFLGLMGRPTLPDGACLWLPESNGIHMMFMRFAIDAVFVGRREAGLAH